MVSMVKLSPKSTNEGRSSLGIQEFKCIIGLYKPSVSCHCKTVTQIFKTTCIFLWTMFNLQIDQQAGDDSVFHCIPLYHIIQAVKRPVFGQQKPGPNVLVCHSYCVPIALLSKTQNPNATAVGDESQNISKSNVVLVENPTKYQKYHHYSFPTTLRLVTCIYIYTYKIYIIYYIYNNFPLCLKYPRYSILNLSPYIFPIPNSFKQVGQISHFIRNIPINGFPT